MAEPIEPAVVEAAVQGDRSALGRLLGAYQQSIYNVCLRMLGHADDAAETAQESLLKIIEHIGEFRGQSHISTWMTRIAMNQAVSRMRQRKLRLTTSLDVERTALPDGQARALSREIADGRELSPPVSVEQQEEREQLQAALVRIEEDFRAVLVLRDIQDLDYQQIAQVLEIPVGTVKSRLFRARLALRHEMLKTAPPPRAALPKDDGHA